MDEYDNTKFLTVEEIASMLRKKERTIREWCYNQSIPHYKVGNSLLFKENDVLDWVEVNCRVICYFEENDVHTQFSKKGEIICPPRLQIKKEYNP